MKKLVLLIALFATSLCTLTAQVIHIELNLLNHTNGGNNNTGCVLEPTSGNYKMYIHSGVCSATTAGVPDSTDCQNPNFVWEHVVGDWGLDNTYGLMTKVQDSLWSIDIDLASYYSDPQTISQNGQGSAGASTPKPVGAPAYSMGFVFRNEDGTIGGLTGGCTDFFIFNLHQGNTSVDVGLPGYTLPDSTFGVSSTVGINDIVNVSFKSVYPNPFSDEVKFTYQTTKELDDISFTIYNALGQQVRALYSGPIQSGVSTINWDGFSDGGAEVQAGVYYVAISDGKNVKTDIIVKQ